MTQIFKEFEGEKGENSRELPPIIAQGLLGLSSLNAQDRSRYSREFIQWGTQPGHTIPAAEFLYPLAYPADGTSQGSENRHHKVFNAFLKEVEKIPGEVFQEPIPLIDEDTIHPAYDIVMDRVLSYPARLANGETDNKKPTPEQIEHAVFYVVVPMLRKLDETFDTPEGLKLFQSLYPMYKSGGLKELIEDRIAGTQDLRKHATLDAAYRMMYFMGSHYLKCGLQLPDTIPLEEPAQNLNPKIQYSSFEAGYKAIEQKMSETGYIEGAGVFEIKDELDFVREMKVLWTRLRLMDYLSPDGRTRIQSVIRRLPSGNPMIGHWNVPLNQYESPVPSYLREAMCFHMRNTITKLREIPESGAQLDLDLLLEISDIGIRDLADEDKQHLEEVRISARSGLSTLSLRGDQVNFKNGRSSSGAMYGLGFDNIVFTAHKGGFRAEIVLLGKLIEVVFDKDYRLETVGGMHIPTTQKEKMEAVLLEYVNEIRMNGHVEPKAQRDMELLPETHMNGGNKGSQRAHLRVLCGKKPSIFESKRNDVPLLNAIDALGNESERRSEEILNEIRGIRDAVNEVAEYAEINREVEDHYGFDLVELNIIFSIAQKAEIGTLRARMAELFPGKSIPQSTIDLMDVLCERRSLQQARSGDIPSLTTVTFVRESKNDNGTHPHIVLCTGANAHVQSNLLTYFGQ